MKIRRWIASIVRVVALAVPVAWMACGPSPAPSSTTTEAVVIAECDRYATAFEQCFATLGADAETVTTRAAAIRAAARKQAASEDERDDALLSCSQAADRLHETCLRATEPTPTAAR